MTSISTLSNPTAQVEIAEALNQSVAETTVTTMLAQNFHWNVTGMAFGPLHDLFQEIYEDHFTGQDDLAERIKAVGGHAEGMLAGMVSRSKVTEHDGHASDREMISMMLDAQETFYLKSQICLLQANHYKYYLDLAFLLSTNNLYPNL
mgnify:CR=1 FL=1